MAGRPKGYNKDTLVIVAQSLFQKKGYSGTSLTDLITEMKVSKSTFYSVFDSKDDLYRICLENYGKSFFREMVQNVMKGPAVIDSLKEYFQFIAGEQERTQQAEGCLLVSSASEIGQTHPTLSPIVRELMSLAKNTLKNALELALRKGELAANLDTDEGANFLLAQMCAVRTLVKSGVSTAELKRFVENTFEAFKYFSAK